MEIRRVCISYPLTTIAYEENMFKLTGIRISSKNKNKENKDRECEHGWVGRIAEETYAIAPVLNYIDYSSCQLYAAC